MSMSISRGPLRKLGVRPTAFSMSWVARSRPSAVPFQRIAATAFQNGRWRRYPTGSVR